MNKKRLVILLLIIFFANIYYILINENVFLKSFYVKKIIDADTIVLDNDIKIRLKGVNAPEKGMIYYEESINFLKSLIENKSIKLKHYGVDKYNRYLGYIFIGNKNINELLLANGYATLYYYELDEYYDNLKISEEFARRNNLGIWKKSKYYDCFDLIELDYNDSLEGKNETLILYNNCNITLDVTFKDDATHIYSRSIKPGYYVENFVKIFNNDKDSLYVWDKNGLLEFYRYSN
ncbi:MAG: thermonuclease family protein [Candidatus Pacearchaeota archaeon]